MKYWKAFAQINGDCVSYYPQIEFKVTESLYAKIQNAISKEKLLCECSFYSELVKRAEDELNRRLPELLDFESLYEKPDVYDYDMGDENERAMFKEALADYEAHLDDVWDDFSCEYIAIDDPTKEIVFKKQFVGRTFEEYADDEQEGDYDVDFLFENDENCQSFAVSVSFTSQGTVTDVDIYECSAMECDDVKSSSWDECYPDYEYVAEMLEEELN